MDFNYDYDAKGRACFGKNGMVATSQKLASLAGLDILKKGGNAIDAAVTMASCMTVLEPTSNGLGADAFAIVSFNGKLYGLNSSGLSPKSLDINYLKEKNMKEIPKWGFVPVMVPGAVKAWIELSKRFGKLPFKELLKPAIDYARFGYPVANITVEMWQRSYEIYKKNLKTEEFKAWFDTFAKNKRAPRAGEIFKCEDLARSLEKIAESETEDFYNGELADKIDAYSRKFGGFIRKEDLENHKAKWIDPISVSYRGYDIWELPPNSDGIIALMSLKLSNGFNFDKKDNISRIHKEIESLKLAFADGKEYISDDRYMKMKIEKLLDDKYLDKRRALIGENAIYPEAGDPDSSSTIYLASADKDGNMVSFIQSCYQGFGSALVIPETGIALSNRGCGFNLDENSPNCLGGEKRSFHTIIPGFITKNEKALGPFGVMGGFMQPQGHLQVISNMIDMNMNPQEALNYPRWQWTGGKSVLLENDFDNEIIDGLKTKGHDIKVMKDFTSFGRGQIIIRNEEDIYIGGSEKRADGDVLAF